VTMFRCAVFFLASLAVVVAFMPSARWARQGSLQMADLSVQAFFKIKRGERSGPMTASSFFGIEKKDKPAVPAAFKAPGKKAAPAAAPAATKFKAAAAAAAPAPGKAKASVAAIRPTTPSAATAFAGAFGRPSSSKKVATAAAKPAPTAAKPAAGKPAAAAKAAPAKPAAGLKKPSFFAAPKK